MPNLPTDSIKKMPTEDVLNGWSLLAFSPFDIGIGQAALRCRALNQPKCQAPYRVSETHPDDPDFKLLLSNLYTVLFYQNKET